MNERLQDAGSESPLMPTYAPAPVTFVRGEGARLYDAQGREYIDLLSGLAVTSLGHAHPRVTAAVAAQAGRLLHVSNLFGNELAPLLAVKLDRLVTDGQAGGRGKVFFANSGAEANECAIKLARRFGGPGRYEVISALGSFHGRTLATLHATGQLSKHEAFRPMPGGFAHVAYGDLDALEDAVGPSTAAVLLEVVQGEGGVVPAPAGYLEGVREICDRHHLLLMVDEVQTGLGRTGRWFAFQHHGVLPDVVTVAKALGNGMPISACWARDEVAKAFSPGDHATTFGGQPLAVSAGIATLEAMEEMDAPGLASSMGNEMAARLATMPGVVEVRGMGLLLAAVVSEPVAAEVARAALDGGVVVNAVSPVAVRLAPPFVLSAAEADRGLDALARAIAGAVTPAGHGDGAAGAQGDGRAWVESGGATGARCDGPASR
ncbi:MAG: acetylornithine/succinylornithine family transaminase [Acidimicrobiales bacterium]